MLHGERTAGADMGPEKACDHPRKIDLQIPSRKRKGLLLSHLRGIVVSKWRQ